jgi:DNA replication protein DnaC
MAERTEVCPQCAATGWRMERRGDDEVAVPCECRRERRRAARLRAAGIPARYAVCTLEGFELWNPDDPTLRQARDRAKAFVECYPLVDKGLLLMGPAGTGKTHLATAVLRELIASKDVQGLYVDMLELIQQLQMSFESSTMTRERILSPVVETELLVLDELGAGKTTAWVMDLIYYIINTRYMRKRLTICTTNFKDVASTPGEETLADRVSSRVRSRLFEMGTVVQLRGEDYRQRILAARGR